jgi:hypothetical protein
LLAFLSAPLNISYIVPFAYLRCTALIALPFPFLPWLSFPTFHFSSIYFSLFLSRLSRVSPSSHPPFFPVHAQVILLSPFVSFPFLAFKSRLFLLSLFPSPSCPFYLYPLLAPSAPLPVSHGHSVLPASKYRGISHVVFLFCVFFCFFFIPQMFTYLPFPLSRLRESVPLPLPVNTPCRCCCNFRCSLELVRRYYGSNGCDSGFSGYSSFCCRLKTLKEGR